MKSEGMQSCANQKSEVSGLERALTNFLSPRKLARLLTQVLIQACKAGKVSHDEVEEMLRDDPEDVLLLGFQWRLLVPARSARATLEWGDAVLLPKPGEMHKTPNVVESLVKEAIRISRWDPENAIAEILKVMGEPGWKRIPELVHKLEEESKSYNINAIQIKKIGRELDLEDRVASLIAELKGNGIMSLKLGSLLEVIRQGSPLYELNPSIFVNRTGR